MSKRVGLVVRATTAAVWGARLELLEVLFVIAFVIGVGMICLPAAWMVAGILGVLWCERAAPRAKTTSTRRTLDGVRRAA